MRILVFSPDLEMYRDQRGIYRFSIRLIKTLKILGYEVDLLSSTIPNYGNNFRRKRSLRNSNLLKVISDLTKSPGEDASFQVSFDKNSVSSLNKFLSFLSYIRALFFLYFFPYLKNKRLKLSEKIKSIDYSLESAKYINEISGFYMVPFLSRITTNQSKLLLSSSPTINCSGYDFVIQTQPFNIKVIGSKLYTICHDIFPCWSDIHGGDMSLHAINFLNAFQNSSKILTISQSNFNLISDFLDNVKSSRQKEIILKKVKVIRQSVSQPEKNFVDYSYSKKGKADKSMFISIGTLEKRKRQHLLVNMFLNNKKLENSELHLIGNADIDYLSAQISPLYFKALKKFLKKPKYLSQGIINTTFTINVNNVYWHCNAEDYFKNKLLAESKAIIFPSLNEGFGIPIVEGMLMGVPVIASNIDVFKEISNDLIFFNNEFDLAEKTIELSQQPTLRFEDLRNKALGFSKDDAFVVSLKSIL